MSARRQHLIGAGSEQRAQWAPIARAASINLGQFALPISASVGRIVMRRATVSLPPTAEHLSGLPTFRFVLFYSLTCR